MPPFRMSTPIRSGLLTDLLLFNAKLWFAGIAAAVLVPLSLGAAAWDALRGYRRGGAFDRLLLASARLERNLDLHAPLRRDDA